MKSMSGRAERRNHQRSEVPGRQWLSSLVSNLLASVVTLADGIRLCSLSRHSIMECSFTLIRP